MSSMILDVRTMYIAMGVTCFVVAATLLILQIGRLQRDGVLQWALGWAVEGAMWLLMALRGIVGDFLSIVVANTCLIAGYSLIYAAVRRFRGCSYNTDILLVPVAVTFIFFWYFSVDNLSYRVLFVSLLAFLQTGGITWALLRHVPVKERLSHWLTGFGFFVMALFWLNRLIEGLTLPYAQLSVLHATIFRNPGVLAMLGAAVLSAIGFALMLRERAEEARRESEQRWATTLASIGDAVIAANVEGKITFMNAVAEGLTGWTLKEAVKKQVTEVFNIVNEQTRKSAENPVAKVIREGMVVGLANHTILVRKDGTEAPIDDSAAPIRDGDGHTTGVVLVFRDITERRKAEERIRYLASLPQLNPNVIIEVNTATGKIVYCNPGTERILESAGMNKGDCTPFLPTDLDAVLRGWDKTSESTVHREVAVKEMIFDETIHLIPQFNAARIYAVEITERERAGNLLQSTLQRFYAILSGAYGAILLVTDDGFVEFANQAFCDMFGLDDSPAELKGLTDRQMIEKIRHAYLHPEKEIARIREIVAEGKPVKGEEVPMAGGHV